MPPVSNRVLTNANNAATTADDFNPENKDIELLDARTGDVCKKSEDIGNITLQFN